MYVYPNPTPLYSTHLDLPSMQGVEFRKSLSHHLSLVVSTKTYSSMKGKHSFVNIIQGCPNLWVQRFFLWYLENSCTATSCGVNHKFCNIFYSSMSLLAIHFGKKVVCITSYCNFDDIPWPLFSLPTIMTLSFSQQTTKRLVCHLRPPVIP